MSGRTPSWLLLCRSESWTTVAKQEKKLNNFHTQFPYNILGISWSSKVPYLRVCACAGLPTMYILLRQCRLHWLGHMPYIADGRIPKDILYGELPSGKWPKGRPQLQYKDLQAHHESSRQQHRDMGGHCSKTPSVDSACSRSSLRPVRRGTWTWQKRGMLGRAHAHTNTPPSPQPSTSALYAAGTATSALVLPATVHAALGAALQTPMAQYPWSTNNWRRLTTTTSHNNNNK